MKDLKKLLSDIKFRAYLIRRINDCIDIPIIIEEHEAIVFDSLLCVVLDSIHVFDDDYMKYIESYLC
jgi:hypothetical protein